MTQALDIIANDFNIDNLDDVAGEPQTFKVAVALDADGEDKCGFFIVGKDSPEYQAAARDIRVQGLKKSAKRKTSLDASTDEGATVVAKLIDTNELTLAISVVKDWFGFKTNSGKAVFNKDMASKLLVKYPTWREKISAALEVDANFPKG